jgi:hypothetical protein
LRFIEFSGGSVKQIPYGNDNQISNGKSKGMTTRKATAKAKE